MAAGGNDGLPLSEINVTPMVDVLLVLLIIFMITAPTLKHNIQIDLPQPNENVEEPKDPPTPIDLRISANGNMTWNKSPVNESTLEAQLTILGTKPVDLQAMLRIQADPDTKYERLAQIMAKAKNASVKKIGFKK